MPPNVPTNIMQVTKNLHIEATFSKNKSNIMFTFKVSFEKDVKINDLTLSKIPSSVDGVFLNNFANKSLKFE